MDARQVHRHPAWFGSVMGTGATATAVALQSDIWQASWLMPLAVAFLLLATVLALVLWPRYVRRLADRGALRAELGDPAHGALLATFPAGLLVLAVAWGRVGPQIVPESVAVGLDVVLLALGTVIAVAVGIAWAGAMATGTNDLAAVNGGWLIPPVMNLLVPVALLPVIAHAPDQAPWLVVVGFAFLGIGTVLFLVMFTVLVLRLALYPPQPAQMAPSLWIPLAPAGILGFALLRLLQAAQTAGVDGFTSSTAGIVVASMLIGLGLWWAAFAGYEVLRLRRDGVVPFHPGWWGFVFPVAAMALSVSAVGQALASTAVEVAGATLTGVLLVVWAVVTVRTVTLIRAVRSASLVGASASR